MFRVVVVVASILVAALSGAADEKAVVVANPNVPEGDIRVTGLTEKGEKVEVAKFCVVKDLSNVLTAPIGSVYGLEKTKLDEIKDKPEVKEMLDMIPPECTARTPRLWMRPAEVLVRRSDLEITGVVSFSKAFGSFEEAAGYMRNVISKDLKDHFAEDVVVSECGNAELRHAYRKNGKVFELRFLFCKVEGGKTVIITYHGYPRCKPNESMQNDFIIFYQNLLRQRAK